MTTLQDILFPVEMVEQEEFKCNSDYAYDIFAYPNIEGETRKLRVNSCSDRYELVPNSEIFPNIRQVLMENNIQFTESYEMIDHCRFYAKYTLENPELAHTMGGSNGDIIKPVINIQHSYNGMTKYKIHFGFFRLVCSNGLVLPVEEMKEFNLEITGKHTASIKVSFEKLDAKLKYFIDNAPQIKTAITAKYETLSGNMVENVQDRIKEVLGVINLKERETKKGISFPAMDVVMETINSEVDLYGGVVNDWLIYNGVNRYIFDEQFKAAPEARQKKDSEVFEFMLS